MDDDIPDLVSLDQDKIDNDSLSKQSDSINTQNLVQNQDNFKKVPVTIITGFLGSGKTTFLKYVLHSPDHGKRIAVVQNEFGEEIGLERAMVMGKRPSLVDVEQQNDSGIQEWLELPNGCICCTAKDNLVVALETLVEKRDRFDYIFVETTGMADPGPLASTLWVDDSLKSSIYLDAVVTIVDAKLILHHLNHQKSGESHDSNVIESHESGQQDNINNIRFEPRKQEAMKQIAISDVIMINKIDLVTPEEIERIKQKIHSINSLSPIILTERSQVDLDKVMGINAFDGTKLLRLVENQSNTAGTSNDKHNHSQHDDHPHDTQKDHKKPHSHSDGVFTVLMQVSGDVISTEVVSNWFAQLLWEHKIPIYRIKGELSVVGSGNRYIVQGVHDNFEIVESPFSWDEKLPQPTINTKSNQESTSSEKVEERCNKLVFIGQNLDVEWLSKSFAETCVST